jgi:hypothetical protein
LYTQNSKNVDCGFDKEDSVHTVCHCPVLACKRYKIWGSIFLRPEDPEKVRVGNTGLVLAPESYEPGSRYSGT